MAANNASDTAPVTYRFHRPGDLGMIVHRHGVLYLEELGCEDPRFESYVAQIAADFLAGHDSTKERCWIAEQDGQFVGSIMLIKDSNFADGAKLRFFLVELKARRLGVGQKLIELCIGYAKEAGYKRIRLQTDCGLTAARRLYKKEGFEIAEMTTEKLFDFEKGGEIWEKVF